MGHADGGTAARDWQPGVRSMRRRRSRRAAAAAAIAGASSPAAGLVLGGAAVSGFGGSLPVQPRGAVTAAREAIGAADAGRRRAPRAYRPAPISNAAQLAPYVTPNADFYRIDTALVVPQVDPDDLDSCASTAWCATRSRSPSTDLLRAADDRAVRDAGLRLQRGRRRPDRQRALAGHADQGPARRGRAAAPAPTRWCSRSVDGWTCGTPTAVLRDGRDALLAVGMNGEPLPVEHGFPVRMVVPGLYGYVSACKWITELELTTLRRLRRLLGAARLVGAGPIKTQSRIDTPRGGAKPDGRPGHGRRGRVGAAPRHRARSRCRSTTARGSRRRSPRTVSIDTWRQWSWQWDGDAGRSTRCGCGPPTATGETQTSTAGAAGAGRRHRVAQRST